MKIGLVLNTVPHYSETFFSNKIKGLTAAGFEVLLFVDEPTNNIEKAHCKVVSARQFSSRGLRRYFSLITAVLEMFFKHPKQSLLFYNLEKKDGVLLKQRIKKLIMYQHFFRYQLNWLHFGFGTLAKGRENLAEAINAQMGVSFRGYDLYLSPLKHQNCFDLLFTKTVSYHVLAEEMKLTLIEYGIQPQKIQVIPPAIDVTFFASEEKKQKDNSKPYQLTSIARLHWKKGLEYTLEALALVKAMDISFQYTIIGDGEELERLQFAAYQLGLSNQINFTGKLTQKEIKTKLQHTDLYLQYSIQEGFCNAVLEAQAMELLCIVSNAEGLTENVIDGVTGWVVPKRQPILLASKIKEVLNLPDHTKAQFCFQASSRVKKVFHLEQQRLAFVEFYSES